MLMTQLPSIPAASDIPFADPIAMELLDGVPPTGDLGVFVQQPRGLGLIDPMTLAKAYTTVRAITNAFGLGRTTGIKTIYQQIPQSMIRVTGGHGVWTDTVTGETMNDLATEVRKMAVLASALGIFVNRDNWFFDDTTGQHLSPDTVLARWNTLFGTGTSFQQAYSQQPELFRVYGPDPSEDPVISTVGKVEQAPPLPPDQRSGYKAGLVTTMSGVTPAGGSSGGPVSGGGTTGGSTQATIAGLSPMTLAAVVGGAVLLTMLARKKR